MFLKRVNGKSRLRVPMPETETKAKVLIGLGIIGALFPVALELYFNVAGSIRAYWGDWSFPNVPFVLPVYVVALMLRRIWGFYIAVLILLAHFLLVLFFVVLLQHGIYFLDPEYRSLSLWRFELRLLQLIWPWILSVVLMFLGIVGNARLLRTRYGCKAFDNKVTIKGKVLPLWEILVVVAVVALLMGVLMPALTKVRHTVTGECASNLWQLGKAIQLYAEQSDGVYPTSDKWCDLLLEGDYLKSEKCFKCPAVTVGRCHYAMNPNCSPNSPNDVVLLFETKGGWSQYGGPELLTFNNHKGKGANVLFNDSWIKFIKPEEVDQLRWKPDEAQQE